jgi:hypothetical protein
MTTNSDSTTKEHTPTPWEATLDRHISEITTAGETHDPIADVVNEMDAIHIVRCVNERDELLEALETISRGEGRFSRDPLTHADNCVEDMKAIATKALAKARGEAS